MRPALKRLIVSIIAAPLAVGCHNEEDCASQTLPASVELEVTLTGVASAEGCDGLGASLGGEPLGHTTGEPIDVGARAKCLTETLQPPSGELYGFNIDYCSPDWGGFTCEGSLVACPEQNGRLEVNLHFGDLPAAGSESPGLYAVEVSADAQGACAEVRCRQLFDSVTRRP